MDDKQIKHLEFIQGVITRFGSNSFLIKGWSLTITVALYGYTVSNLSWSLALVALLPGAIFWFLDTYFLRHERLFRRLYDEVRKPGSDVAPFSMNIQPYRELETWRKTAFSITLVPFYGTILAAGFIILVASLWPTC